MQNSPALSVAAKNLQIGQTAKQRLAVLWDLLCQECGRALWEASHGDVPNQLWIDLLTRLSDKEIQVGLVAIREKSKRREKEGLTCYPPKIGEFEAMCEGPKVINSGAYRLFTPEKRTDTPLGREAGLRKVAELRQALAL